MNLMQVAQKTMASTSGGAAAAGKKKAGPAGNNAGMTAAACLGVIRLDYDYPPAPGDIDCPDSFSYDVYYRVVPGLTFDICQSGQITQEIQDEFVDGIKWLEQKGVKVIT